jgi:hypothetical protein
MKHFLAEKFWGIVAAIAGAALIFSLIFWVFPWARSYQPKDFEGELLTVQDIRKIYSKSSGFSDLPNITVLLVTDKGEYKLPSELVDLLKKGDLIQADGYSSRDMEYPFISSFERKENSQ